MNTLDPRHGRHPVTAARGSRSGGSRFSGRLFAPLGHRMLDRIDAGLIAGSLEAHLPDGTTRLLGDRAPGFACVVELVNWRALLRLALGGSAGWYRAWAAGEWRSPDPVPLFALFMANARALGDAARARGPVRWLARAFHALRANHRVGARRNIAFHYDLGNDFYGLWLDPEMNYSSALFGDEQCSLEAAQHAKNDAILDRLALKDGDLLLEIGCGWGALAQRALERAELGYLGLTLSREQHDYAQARLDALGFGDAARIALTDYRDVTGRFDAIASVEMVEAVGQEYWPAYLGAIARLLRPGGRAAIQFISIDDAIFDRYAASADFIQAHVFPGGMLLSRARFRKIAESLGLEWCDEYRFGGDYARTLALWRERFDTAVDAGRLPSSFDERFVRLWRYYLMYCQGGFAGGGIDVTQVTLVRRAD